MVPEPSALRAAVCVAVALAPRLMLPLVPLAVDRLRLLALTTPLVFKLPLAETVMVPPTVEAARVRALALDKVALPPVSTVKVPALVARLTLPVPDVTVSV